MTDAFFALYSLLIGVFELAVHLQNLTLRHWISSYVHDNMENFQPGYPESR